MAKRGDANPRGRTAPAPPGKGVITAGEEVAGKLGVEQEVGLLHERLERWLKDADPELQEALRWALAGRPKHFRPLTVFACRRAVGQTVTENTVEVAFAVELLHNMTLVVDDVLDGSPERRGVATLERHLGTLPALMAAGYLVADTFAACAHDAFAVSHLAELLRRLGAAECLQWRLRRQPLGVADWRRIAGEDTGSMFELCAVLGAGSQRLRRYGHLLGVLYHGCDDVGDLRGLQALGGGGEEDICDGILTLPAALAIRDPNIRELFTRNDADEQRLALLADAYRAQLDEAEALLDQIAASAAAEAEQFADDPRQLLALIEQVRQLSRS
jgi:geranylgeranyl pyrophosphate synthase